MTRGHLLNLGRCKSGSSNRITHIFRTSKGRGRKCSSASKDCAAATPARLYAGSDDADAAITQSSSAKSPFPRGQRHTRRRARWHAPKTHGRRADHPLQPFRMGVLDVALASETLECAPTACSDIELPV